MQCTACGGKKRSTVSTVKLLPPELGPFTATDTGRARNREVSARYSVWAMRTSPTAPAAR